MPYVSGYLRWHGAMFVANISTLPVEKVLFTFQYSFKDSYSAGNTMLNCISVCNSCSLYSNSWCQVFIINISDKYWVIFWVVLFGSVSTRVSLETCFASKQPKLEPKLVSALSVTKCLFRLFRFYIKTARIGVPVKPKSTETKRNKPKQTETNRN